jgi:hypothetical protein
MQHRRPESVRVLLAILLSATAACQADSVNAPLAGEPSLYANVAASSRAAVTVRVGDSVRLTHPFLPADLKAPGAKLTWQVSDSSVLKVDSTGLARGLAPGDVTAKAQFCKPRGNSKKGRGQLKCDTHALEVHVEKAVQTKPPTDTTPTDTTTTDPPTEPVPPMPPQGAHPRGIEGVRWLAGPVPQSAAASTSGWTVGRLAVGAFDSYDRSFERYAEVHWSKQGAAWEQANYYDRAAIYYVWWARTGRSTYLERANALALDYRRNYLEKAAMPYTYNASTYWHMPLGLALHYLVTGDEKSRLAVGYSAEWVGGPHTLRELDKKTTMPLPSTARTQSPIGGSLPSTITVGTAENRWRARVLQAYVLSHAIAAPQGGPATKQVGTVPGTWAEKAKVALDKILSIQNPDGSYRDEQSGGAEKPFMDGLLNDALILYYQFVARDPRIISAVRRNLDYNWANTWLGDSFAYYEWSYTSPVDPSWAGGRYAAGDLNGLLVGAFGWVYAQTKDVKYRDRGDEIFSTITSAYLGGSKQFNQSYASSYRYLVYRTGQVQ